MSFEDDIAALARRQREREREQMDRAARLKHERQVASRETIAGFVRVLRAHAFEPVPIYVTTTFRKAKIWVPVQHHERAGAGWHLTVPDEGGHSSLAITESGEASNSASLRMAPDHGDAIVTNKGLPRRGYYICCRGLSDEHLLNDYEESAITAAAVAIVNGERQERAGSAG